METPSSSLGDFKALFSQCAYIGVSKSGLRKGLKRDRLAEAKQIAENKTSILTNIEHYASFFDRLGFSCPLPDQFARATKDGLPSTMPFIQLLLTAEMTTGVLIGFHDHAAIQGAVTLEVATSGDSFQGARAPISCKAGELVLQDSQGIIGSYFQGPVQRTAIKSSSTDVAVFYFDVPGVPRSALEDAERKVHHYLAPAAREYVEKLT